MLPILAPGDYFGASDPRYDGDGIAIAHTRFSTDLIIPRHEHLQPFFCFVTAGVGTRSWPARAGREEAMALTLFPAGLPHANRWYGAGGQALHLEFSPQWLERLGGRTRVLERPANFAGGPPVSVMRRLIAECSAQDAVTSLAVEGLVLELVASCERSLLRAPALSRRRRWLERVETLLRERFHAPPTLYELAAEANVSADYVARRFHTHFGCTIGEYVRRLRIDYACERLAHGSEPLAVIAQAAGFADQSHFTRTFRRALGMTPRVYRERAGVRSGSTT
jgi:AraC family transcriptional regulator